jgi:hypothetical protein
MTKSKLKEAIRIKTALDICIGNMNRLKEIRDKKRIISIGCNMACNCFGCCTCTERNLSYIYVNGEDAHAILAIAIKHYSENFSKLEKELEEL